MNACEKFKRLHPRYQDEIHEVIKYRICGKSHIADISIEDSDIPYYAFKATVCKYNTVKGWATIGYLRHAGMKKWIVTFNPKLRSKANKVAGRTGAYY